MREERRKERIKRKGFQRILAWVLAVTMVVPMTANAAVWTDATDEEPVTLEVNADVDSADTVTFSDVIENVGEPAAIELTKEYTLTWGEGAYAGSQTVSVNVKDTLYHFNVGETVYNNKETDENEKILFESGEYNVYSGDAEYTFKVKEGNEWYNKLSAANTAEDELDVADQEVTTAKAALLAEQGKLSAAELAAQAATAAVTTAENNLADAETSRANAQKLLEAYNAALKLAQVAYDGVKDSPDWLVPAEKKAKLKAALDTAQKDYDAQYAIVNDAEAYKKQLEDNLTKAKASKDSADAAVTSQQAVVNTAQAAVTTAEENAAAKKNSCSECMGGSR